MKTILIIEDDKNMRFMCHEMLAEEGYQVLEAEHGKAGMKVLEGNNANAVITDIVMPEQEGLETIKAIRKMYHNIKIIAMSGGGQYAGACDYLLLAQHLGAHQTLRKPFMKEELLSALRTVLEEA